MMNKKKQVKKLNNYWIWKKRYLFGHENAWLDQFLYECFIFPTTRIFENPILAGRWSSGKTAIFLARNKSLSDFLSSIDEYKKYIWYIDEKSLDVDSLLSYI